MYHCSVILASSLLDSYALPISRDILSFNQLTDKVRSNVNYTMAFIQEENVKHMKCHV